MKRLVLFAALIATIVFGQPQTGGFGAGGNAGRTGPSFGRSLAFFEFAPPERTGMGSACSCLTPTGAKGEVLTFTRTGDATCSRSGLATTGINNGDLTVCTANQPRVEPSGGVLGLRVEDTRTNGVVRSQEINNAAWLPQNSGVGTTLPTITANAATAPDGTLTADRVQYSDCALAASFSLVQSSGSVQTAAAGSIYVRGNGASGNIGLALNAPGGVAVVSVCAYVSTSWTRCQLAGTGAASTASLYFGCGNGVVGGMTQTGSGDVFVWGGQVENGAYATSYIPTVASAVTRNAETTSLTSTVLPLTGSVAVTTQRPYGSALASNQTLVDALVSTSSGWRFSFVGSQLRIEKGGPLASVGATTTWAAVEAPRWAASFDGANASLFVNGTVLIGPSVLAGFTGPTYTPVGIGWDHQGFASFDGIISRVCVDPDPNRCR